MPSANQLKQPLLRYALLAAGLIGYALPWVVAAAAPLTLHAYDLAEWASLHPAQWQTAPPLLAPLMLRAQLLILSLLLGLAVEGRLRLAGALIIVLLAIAQAPPPEFLRDLASLNYRQQFFLAAASLVAGLGALRFNAWLARQRILPLLIVVLTVIGISSAYAGLQAARALYTGFGLENSAGLGLWLLILSYGGQLGLALLAARGRRRAG